MPPSSSSAARGWSAPSRLPEGAHLVEIDDDHAKAVAFNMLFVVWRKRTAEASFRRSTDVVVDLAARFGEGVGVCHVVEVTATPPDARVRRAFVDFLRCGVIKHISVTYEGAGFKAAAVRAVMTGAFELSQPSAKHAVHGDLETAAKWHALAQASLQRSESAATMTAIVRSMRRLLSERSP